MMLLWPKQQSLTRSGPWPWKTFRYIVIIAALDSKGQTGEKTNKPANQQTNKTKASRHIISCSDFRVLPLTFP